MDSHSLQEVGGWAQKSWSNTTAQHENSGAQGPEKEARNQRLEQGAQSMPEALSCPVFFYFLFQSWLLQYHRKFAQPDGSSLQELQLTETVPLHRAHFLSQTMTFNNGNYDLKGKSFKRNPITGFILSSGQCLGQIHLSDPRVALAIWFR